MFHCPGHIKLAFLRHAAQKVLKGTVARDFLASVFFMDLLYSRRGMYNQNFQKSAGNKI